MPTFAEKLRELRQAAGMTQEALARACDLSLGSVRNYEQGIREPLWDVIFRLAATLGVSCEVFKECAGASTEGRSAEGPARKPSGEKRPARGKGSKGKG